MTLRELRQQARLFKRKGYILFSFKKSLFIKTSNQSEFIKSKGCIEPCRFKGKETLFMEE